MHDLWGQRGAPALALDRVAGHDASGNKRDVEVRVAGNLAIGVAVGGAVAGVAWWLDRRRSARTLATFVQAAGDALVDSTKRPVPESWPQSLAPLARRLFACRDHQLAIEGELARQQRTLAEREEAARASEATLREVLDRMQVGLVGLDSTCRHTYVSASAARLLERPAASLMGRTIWECFPETVSSPLCDAIARAYREQCDAVVESPFGSTDRWFLHHIYPSHDGLSVFFEEVTEQKRTERAMVDARLRLDLAIEASGIGVWEWDLETNRSWVRYSALRREIDPTPEYAGDIAPWLARFHSDDLPRVLAARDAHIRDRTPSFEVEFRTLEVDKKWHWTYASAAVQANERGEPTRLIGMHMDVTARKLLEEDLVRSREELRALAASVEQAREQERTRLAREFHDELGQSLSVLSMDSAWVEQHVAGVPAVGARIAAMRAVLVRTVHAVRRMATELRPGVLDDLGLAAAVRWQAGEFARSSNQHVVLAVDEIPGIVPEAATAVFRILQESLTNVSRHAQSTEVHIALHMDEDALLLTVTDNGVGLPDVPAGTPSRSFGLLGMSERAHLWAGEVRARRGANGGTVVQATLPRTRVCQVAS